MGVFVFLVIVAVLVSYGFYRARRKYHAAVSRHAKSAAKPVSRPRPVPELRETTVNRALAFYGYDAPTGEYDRYGNGRKSVTQKVKIQVADRDDGKCRRCGSKEELQYDHVIPLKKGGANTVKNIQLLCGPCNRSKAAQNKPYR